MTVLRSWANLRGISVSRFSSNFGRCFPAHAHHGRSITHATRQSTSSILTMLIRNALYTAFGDAVGKDADTHVSQSKNEYGGDYQCNAAMKLSKLLNKKPKDIAQSIIDNMVYGDIVKDMNVSGSGFINIVVSDTYVSKSVENIVNDKSGRLSIHTLSHVDRKRVIVDYSSPNIAKDMHVGHLRSTIIGDSLSRIFEFIGHDVIRLNHVGDWGTQFGMLIHFMNQQKDSMLGSSVSISDLVKFYQSAKKRFDEDTDFQEASRQEVVKLQNGDFNSLKAWGDICAASRREFQTIYEVLNIRRLQERGESFYNPYLSDLVNTLSASGMIVQSDGASCVFLPGYKNADGTPQPLILRKSDGAYLYATTDLAAVQHRTSVECADLILYITDAGQALHFKMVFDAARAAGFLDRSKLNMRPVELKHVPFGVVQGEDGKKLKTRSGDSVKLKELLDEAVRKAEESLSSREGLSLTAEQRSHAAKVIGIGAVKYADLSMHRESNYRFSFEKMLSLNGNTAPYLLYAFARIQGIKRKTESEIRNDQFESVHTYKNLVFESSEELILAKHLIRFQDVIQTIEKDLCTNILCEYLFELCQKFNQFYENCPVLRANSSLIFNSRTALCLATSNTLALGLDLLGITTLEKL